VAAGVPTLITSAAQGESSFGRGSMLSAMFNVIKKANPYTETWGLALDDAGAGVTASGSVAFAGTVSQAGTLALYIAGTRIAVAVAAAEAAATTATNVAAAINADTSLPVIASPATNTVTITARHKGVAGNDIDIRTNYYQGERLPTGLTATITAMASGATNPDISTAIAAMGAEWWNTIVMPYTDSANLVLLEAELTSRFGPTRMIDGVAFGAVRATHANTVSFGTARNHAGISYMGTSIAPQPPYLWAAVYAAVAAGSLSIDPARPLQTLELPGILPPAIAARFTLPENNILLYDGISTFSVTDGGTVQIQRAVTSYQKNSFGIADPSYLDVETPYTLSYIRYATRARITQRFPRFKLADDGTRFGAGQAIVTPKDIRNTLLALFRELESAGLVENFDQYATDLVVERDANDRNRVNVLAAPDIVNQFRIFAEQIQFIV
jgi:phage tail sheath gpL-like